VQLTADQQVNLSISGQDKYGNPVDISGNVSWVSSDESVVVVKQGKSTKGSANAVALAVGPTGTAAVTVSNDVDQDGTGDFQGSIAIDVVAGDIAEIVVNQGAVTDKGEPPVVDNTLPGAPPVVDNTPEPRVVVPSLNVTDPVGVPVADEETVAVKVTDAPSPAGFRDESSVVAVPALTDCVRSAEELALKLLSPA